MLQQLSLIGLFCAIWGVALWLANRLGSKKAQLDALREEIKREMRERRGQMRLIQGLIICLLMMCAAACQTLKTTNATACQVGFDYTDSGVNDRNARALLKHYCLCVDEKVCQ